ncbi:MAG: SDR family oxidoreductase [Trueperaceae bacterium]|nr:MAG: SDR family oxidoreductase [Trueperaceae bacterium]
MDLQIAGRVALVTGASQGIGLAVAEGLAAEGARVVLSARREGPLEQAVARIRHSGGEAVGVPADVSRAEQIAALLDETRKLLGDPEILVANAGGPPPGLADQLSEDDWAKGYELTLMSAVRLATAALPAMRARKWGRIVNITSLTVREPLDSLTLSNAFRSAVTGFAKTLSNRVAAEGITVNNVGPGYTATERLEELFEDEAAKERLIEIIPAKRFGTPEEIAAVTVFLASQQAAYLTGQTLIVDGGAVAAL